MAVKRRNNEVTANNQVENTFTWTPQKEVKLFETILSYKPAGLAKHFNMALIHYKLVQQEGFRNLTSQNIWNHLEKFFDLEKADSIEKSFLDDNWFKGDDVEFCLPTREFAEAMAGSNKAWAKASVASESGKKSDKPASDSSVSGSTKKTDKSISETGSGSSKASDKILSESITGSNKKTDKSTTDNASSGSSKKTDKPSTENLSGSSKKADKATLSATPSISSTDENLSAKEVGGDGVDSETPKNTPGSKRSVARSTPSSSAAKRSRKI